MAMIEPDESGHRPVNAWGEGDLPAPYAIGDRLGLVERNVRLHDMGDGPFVVVTAFSVDVGDGWYFRVAEHDGPRRGPVSGRLHVAYAARSSFLTDVDWMSGFELIETADPDGLALRQAMLAEGWTFIEPRTCPTCGPALFRDPGSVVSPTRVLLADAYDLLLTATCHSDAVQREVLERLRAVVDP